MKRLGGLGFAFAFVCVLLMGGFPSQAFALFDEEVLAIEASDGEEPSALEGTRDEGLDVGTHEKESVELDASQPSESPSIQPADASEIVSPAVRKSDAEALETTSTKNGATKHQSEEASGMQEASEADGPATEEPLTQAQEKKAYQVQYDYAENQLTSQSSSELEVQAQEAIPAATISIRTHIQNIGWNQGWRTATAANGKTAVASAGTSGRSLRLEAIQLQLKGISGSIQYQVHVQNDGWQAAKVNGDTAGTSGRALRLEAIRIELTGEVSRWYDIEYRTHVQNVGWQSYVRNGDLAGTTGRGLRLEALDVRLIPKSSRPQSGNEGIVGIRSQAHVQNVGNQAWVREGGTAGTSGQGLRMESIRIQLDKGVYSGSIEYRTHVQNVGWTGWVRDGQLSGTTGRSLRMEALEARLTGAIAAEFEVVYRAHVQNIGWQDWVSGGNTAGTTGRSLRVEALQLQLIRRPSVPTAQRTVSDGLYALKVQSSQGNAAGVAGASDANGANVQLVTDANWRLEEKWQVTWKGDGYELVNLNSGKVLDALNGHQNIVANVQQANRNNSKSQRWAIQANGAGYTIAGMNFGTVLDVQDGKLASGSNLRLWAPTGSTAQRFALIATEPFYEGTYQLFTKLDQSGKCIDVPNGTLANGAQVAINPSNDGPNQHLVFSKSGDGFTIQIVSSGKHLTVSGSNIVQASRNNATSQIWKPATSDAGGLVFVSAATGNVLSVQGNRNASGAVLQQVARANVAGQRWYPIARQLVSNGLYELRTAPASGVVLDVSGGSIGNGANAMVHDRNGGNNQKFAIAAAGDGYYHIGMPLGSTAVAVQGASSANGANVRMENWSNSSAQLWKPVVTDGGLVFVNKASGKALAFDSAKSDANVKQANRADSALQKWSVVATSLNAGDLLSYRMVMQAASGGGLELRNVVPGYSVSSARWNQLVNALNACWSRGYAIGFLMADCSTGMTLSVNADTALFGGSTIKGLWVTYLFQEYIEKGGLSWGQISGLAYNAIVYSDNDAYRALRASYGSESGFANWLGAAGVRYFSLWDTYTPRELASAWMHMNEYAESGGQYVNTWKSLFNHSDHSAIYETLGGSRNTYSKPGWMEAGAWSGTITNDAALVDDRNGRKYLLAIMTNVNPSYDRHLVRNVVAAIDAIHAEMPRARW